MKKLTTILMLIGMALSIGTVQGQVYITPLGTCLDPGEGRSIRFVLDSVDNYVGDMSADVDFGLGNMNLGPVAISDTMGVGGTWNISWYVATIYDDAGNSLGSSDTITFYENSEVTLPTLTIVCGDTISSWNDTVLYTSTSLIYNGFTVNGCDSTVSQYFNVEPYQPSICVVTDDDNDGHNEIVFDIAGGADYNIYRGSDLIYTRISSDNTYFEDEDALNSEFAYSYSIEAIEVGCGVSTLSDVHTAIKLTTSTSSDTVVNLSWNTYQGIDFQNVAYVVERTRGLVTDSIFGVSTDLYLTNTPITKAGHESGDVYQVVVNLQVQCSTQRDNPSIRSNRSNPNSVGINDIDEAINLTIVNPSDGIYLTTDKNVDVDVFDLNGRLLRTYNQVSHLNDDTYTHGMYLVVIKDDVNWIAKKLIIN